MREYMITLDEDFCNEIQRLSFEVESRKSIINSIFDLHKDDPDSSVLTSPSFKRYQNEYTEFFAEYEMKKEVVNTFIPDFLKEHQLSWNLDFSTRTLKITILCDCPIPELDK